MSEVLQIFAHEDPIQGKKPPLRIAESESTVSVDANRLMGLLDEMEGLKQEIQDRMRRMEAVKQAKSLLLEDALRTEALNKRLAELSRAVGGSPTPVRVEETSPDELMMHRNGNPFEARAKVIETRSSADSFSVPWRKLENSEKEWMDFEDPVAHSATAVLNLEKPADDVIRFSPEHEALSMRLEEALEANSEARRLLERSTKELEEARIRAESVTVELQNARLEATQGYETATQRLEEAERTWKLAEEASLEAKRLLEQSILEGQKRQAEETDGTTDFRVVRAELLAASASMTSVLDQLSVSEQYWKQADIAGIEAKKAMDLAITELVRAQAKEEAATGDLNSARQELTTAYQFAAVAAQRRLEATEFFRRAARWCVFSAAASWVASAWFGWFSVRSLVPIWAPGVATAVILGLAMLIGKQEAKES